MIHRTAIIDAAAQLGERVSVGAYASIGPDVRIGDDCWIGSQVLIEGRTRIGRGNRIYPFAVIGGPPQDKKYGGEPTGVDIGDRNTIREYVTINRGTRQDAGVTRVGDDNWIMAYVHFAHDCQIGSNTIFANACQLAGHVHVGDWAVLGATTLIHQFVHVGKHAFTGMGTYLPRDLPPYVKAAGNMAKPYGINSEGLRRRGFDEGAIRALKRAYRTLYRAGLTLEDATRELERQAIECPDVGAIVDLLGATKRGIIR